MSTSCESKQKYINIKQKAAWLPSVHRKTSSCIHVGMWFESDTKCGITHSRPKNIGSSRNSQFRSDMCLKSRSISLNNPLSPNKLYYGKTRCLCQHSGWERHSKRSHRKFKKWFQEDTLSGFTFTKQQQDTAWGKDVKSQWFSSSYLK